MRCRSLRCVRGRKDGGHEKAIARRAPRDQVGFVTAPLVEVAQ
jgi:hypothetical protein